jgi:rRNA maturation protein Nop10
VTNHYAVLDVPRSATPLEVKAAYRAKVREAHPDHGGSAERFAAVQRAYEVLRDAEKRAVWEASYAKWAAERRATPCPRCFSALRTRASVRNTCPRCGSDVSAPSPSDFDTLAEHWIERSADFLMHVGDRLGQEVANATEYAVSKGLAALYGRPERKR